MIATAVMDAATRTAWCREDGLYEADLEAWRRDAVSGLREPRGAGIAKTRQDRQRIEELERELHRRDSALAKTASWPRALLKTRGSLSQGRGRMIRLEDRRTLAREILARACAVAGIDVRTWQRWKIYNECRVRAMVHRLTARY